MAVSRRSYKGAAVSNTVGAGGLASGATSISLAASMSGWPTGSQPFFVVVDPGTTKEEKICVKYSNATTLTVVDPAVTSTWNASVNGRGADDTTDRDHAAGATIYPVFTASEADDANELTSAYTTNGDIVVHGSTSFKKIGVGTNAHVLQADSTVTDGGVKWGQVATAGIADAAVTADKIASAVAGSGLGGGAGTALSVNVDNSTIEINSDTLRLKDGGVTTAKIADGTLLTTDFDTTTAVASGGVPVTTVSTSDPTGGKNGDIWVKVV